MIIRIKKSNRGVNPVITIYNDPDEKRINYSKPIRLQSDFNAVVEKIIDRFSKFYKPEDLIGKNVVLVANLKPVKLRGELSQGMILAASTDDDSVLSVVNPGELPSGSIVR